MKINFQKYTDHLAPAIIQDAKTGRVLMLGFMSRESFEQTQATGKVTFFSRSRQCIWTKGETSGNFLQVENILLDCDSDTLLIKARPHGPTCHTGAGTCFGEENLHQDFLFTLEAVIKARKANPSEDSYTSTLFAAGLNRIIQKVGEEAVELVIASKDANDQRFKDEAADLLYHLLVLFAARNVELDDVIETLKQRSR